MGPEHRPRVRKKETSGRKPSGQHGHEKHIRPLVPPEKVDKRMVVRPTRCRGCKKTLVGHDSNPCRHQVSEWPVIVPFVTEYELHALDCACGTRTVAGLPKGVPIGAFGPGVVARVATLMGVYWPSKRAVAELMPDVFGLNLSVGAVLGCQPIASHARKASVDDAKAFVMTAAVKYA